MDETGTGDGSQTGPLFLPIRRRQPQGVDPVVTRVHSHEVEGEQRRTTNGLNLATTSSSPRVGPPCPKSRVLRRLCSREAGRHRSSHTRHPSDHSASDRSRPSPSRSLGADSCVDAPPRAHSSLRSDSLPFSWSESPLEEELHVGSFASLAFLWPDTITLESVPSSPSPVQSETNLATHHSTLLGHSVTPPGSSMSLQYQARHSPLQPNSSFEVTAEEPRPHKPSKPSIFRRLQSLGYEGKTILINGGRRASAALPNLDRIQSSEKSLQHSPRVPSTGIIMSLASILIGNRSHSPRWTSSLKRRSTKQPSDEEPKTSPPLTNQVAKTGTVIHSLSQSHRSSLIPLTPRYVLKARSLLVDERLRPDSDPTPTHRKASWIDSRALIAAPDMSTPAPAPSPSTPSLPSSPISKESCRISLEVLTPIEEGEGAHTRASDSMECLWDDGEPLRPRLRRRLEYTRRRLLQSSPVLKHVAAFHLSLEHHYGVKNSLCRYTQVIHKVYICHVDNMHDLFAFGPLISTTSAITSYQVMPSFLHMWLEKKQKEVVWDLSPQDQVFDKIKWPCPSALQLLAVSLNHESYPSKAIDALVALFSMLSDFQSCPRLLRCYNDGRATHLLFQRLQGIRLSHFLQQSQSRGPLPWHTCRSLCHEVLKLLAFLHSNNLTLRNIRPDSFFVISNDSKSEEASLYSPTSLSFSPRNFSAEGSGLHSIVNGQDTPGHAASTTTGTANIRLCLIDFSALALADETSLLPPTDVDGDYCAPEALLNNKPPYLYSSPADIFAVGQLLSSMLTGHALLKSGNGNLKRSAPQTFVNADGYCMNPRRAWEVGFVNIINSADNISSYKLLSHPVERHNNKSGFTDEIGTSVIQRLLPEWNWSNFVAYHLSLNDNSIWERKPSLALDLVVRMVTVDPKLRLTAQESLVHPFILQTPPQSQFATQSLIRTTMVSMLSTAEEGHGLENILSPSVCLTQTTIVIPEKVHSRLIDHLLSCKFSTDKWRSGKNSPSQKARETPPGSENIKMTELLSDDTLIAEIEARGSNASTEDSSQLAPRKRQRSPSKTQISSSSAKSPLKNSLGREDSRPIPSQTNERRSSLSRSRRGSQLLTAVAHSFKHLFGDQSSFNSPERAPSTLMLESSATIHRRHSVLPTSSIAPENPVAQLAEFLETRKRMKAAAMRLAIGSIVSDDEVKSILRPVSPIPDQTKKVSDDPSTLEVASSTSTSKDSSSEHDRRLIVETSQASLGETNPLPSPAPRPELFIPSPERFPGSRRASCTASIQPIKPVIATSEPQKHLSRPSCFEARRQASFLRGVSAEPSLPPLPRQLTRASAAAAVITNSAVKSPVLVTSHCLSQDIKSSKAVGPEVPYHWGLMDEDTQTYEQLLLDVSCQTLETRIEKFHKGVQTDFPQMQDCATGIS